jgi:acyl carrier protein
MKNELFERLKQFTIKQTCVSKKILICGHTSIADDLGVNGDDAIDYILAFGKEFNVDVSKFNAPTYFEDEHNILMVSLFKSIFRIKDSKKILRIGHLQKAILLGKLDESVIEFKIFESKLKGLKFKIEEDYPDVGWYLYVFEGEKCTYDYLQDTFQICKEFAFKKFEVPIDSWNNSTPISPISSFG